MVRLETHLKAAGTEKYTFSNKGLESLCRRNPADLKLVCVQHTHSQATLSGSLYSRGGPGTGSYSALWKNDSHPGASADLHAAWI